MKNIESVPHHVQYRSQLGTGTMNNGITLCRDCHNLTHNKKEVRKWCEEWVRLNLDENGDRINLIPLMPFLKPPASP
jgi:predicted  nucleic acid-binding Zn ribbon protein